MIIVDIQLLANMENMLDANTYTLYKVNNHANNCQAGPCFDIDILVIQIIL